MPDRDTYVHWCIRAYVHTNIGPYGSTGVGSIEWKDTQFVGLIASKRGSRAWMYIHTYSRTYGHTCIPTQVRQRIAILIPNAKGDNDARLPLIHETRLRHPFHRNHRQDGSRGLLVRRTVHRLDPHRGDPSRAMAELTLVLLSLRGLQVPLARCLLRPGRNPADARLRRNPRYRATAVAVFGIALRRCHRQNCRTMYGWATSR